MIAKVLFDFIVHFQTKYHSTDMIVIKFNTNKKDCLVCSMELLHYEEVPFILGSLPDNC